LTLSGILDGRAQLPRVRQDFEASNVIETEPGWCAIVVGTGKPARGSGTLGGQPTIVEEILELQVALSGGVDESVSVAVEQEQLALRAHRHERLVQVPAVPPRNQIISCAMTDLEWWGVLADTVNRARLTSDVRDLSRRAAQEPLYHRVAAGASGSLDR
jgi:hypothetical protein